MPLLDAAAETVLEAAYQIFGLLWHFYPHASIQVLFCAFYLVFGGEKPQDSNRDDDNGELVALHF